MLFLWNPVSRLLLAYKKSEPLYIYPLKGKYIRDPIYLPIEESVDILAKLYYH